MEPRFINVPEMKIVGVAGTFISVMSPDKTNMVVIPKLWQQYMPRRHEIKNIQDTFNLGVCIEIPVAERSHPEECLYVAATEVTSVQDVPEGMKSFTIPAGEYAVFTHKGLIEDFGNTLSYIYGTWLPKSGKKIRHAPDVEFYDERFKINDKDSEVDIWVPVE